jgi:hypothetical protein
VEWAEGGVVRELLRGGECGSASGVGIEMNEGIEFWLKSGDTGELGIEELDGRDLFAAD